MIYQAFMIIKFEEKDFSCKKKSSKSWQLITGKFSKSISRIGIIQILFNVFCSEFPDFKHFSSKTFDKKNLQNNISETKQISKTFLSRIFPLKYIFMSFYHT